MTAKDLKNALLQEAVQGRLVPQIASEGNARDLLEEIRKEKLSHGLDFANAKSGKRKSKKETALAGSNPCDITEEEMPFDIPESWCWCRLGEVTEITMGQSPEGINVGETVQGMEFHQGKIFFTDKIIGKSNQQTSEITKVAKENSILLCMRAPVGKINITDREICIGRGLSSIIPFFNVDTMFLYYLLETLESDFNKKATGSTFKAITGDIVRNQAIPLPPLAEQKRIVAAIEKFMPLIEEYGKKETELKAFNEQIGTLTKKAILQEAVQGKLVPQNTNEGNAKDLLEEIKKAKAILIKEGKIKKEKPLPEISDDEMPFDIPESWCWCRLGEVTEITMGQSPEGINVGETVQGMEFHQGKIFFTDKIIGKSNQQTSEITKVAKENSILLCMRAPVGKINITDREICIGRGLSSIIPFFNVDTMFLYYLLETLESDFNKKATGSTFKAITGDIVRNQAIPLPPLAEQKRIVKAIENLLPLCEALKI